MTSQGLQASDYWTGHRHAIRYICWTCADYYDTAPELRAHLEAEHPDVTIIDAAAALAPSDPPSYTPKRTATD